MEVDNNIKNPSRIDRVYSSTSKLIQKLSNNLELSSTKAKLASLRKATSTNSSNSIEAWSFVFEDIDEEFLGKSSKLTYEERAIVSALELYAIHQQGQHESVDYQDGEYWENIGYSLASLRNSENKNSIDRRFNAMITSSTFEELLHHLRQMIKLLKSNSKNTRINYSRLAKDLYKFLLGYQDDIRLTWARTYYGRNIKVEDDIIEQN